MIAQILKYLGLFIVGYFALIAFGLDKSTVAQWILIFLVAFYKLILDKINEIIRSPNDNTL